MFLVEGNISELVHLAFLDLACHTLWPSYCEPYQLLLSQVVCSSLWASQVGQIWGELVFSCLLWVCLHFYSYFTASWLSISRSAIFLTVRRVITGSGMRHKRVRSLSFAVERLILHSIGSKVPVPCFWGVIMQCSWLCTLKNFTNPALASATLNSIGSGSLGHSPILPHARVPPITTISDKTTF